MEADPAGPAEAGDLEEAVGDREEAEAGGAEVAADEGLEEGTGHA